MNPQQSAGAGDEPPLLPTRNRRPNLPAWPLGCFTALLSLLLIVNLLGLTGILFAGAGLTGTPGVLGPTVVAVVVPALMLWGGLFVRRRNPYASRTLLWACALTIVFSAALAMIASLIDRATLGM